MSAQLSVAVMVSRADNRCVAQFLEADISSFGDTQAEALAMVTEALELWFEDAPVDLHSPHEPVTSCRHGPRVSALPEELPVPFEVVTETGVDSRDRVSLGRADAELGGRYRVARNIDGVLLLTPVVSIPERGLIVWEDPVLAERIRTGITEAQAGRTVDLGDVTGQATDTDEG